MCIFTESPASPPDVVAESVSNNKFPSPPDVVAEPAASSRKPPSPSDVVSTPDNAAKVVLEEKASYSRPKSIKKISPTVESLPPLRQVDPILFFIIVYFFNSKKFELIHISLSFVSVLHFDFWLCFIHQLDNCSLNSFSMSNTKNSFNSRIALRSVSPAAISR